MTKIFSEVFKNHKEEVTKCIEGDGITLWLTTKDKDFVTLKAHIAYPDELCEDCDASLDYSYVSDSGRTDGGQLDYREDLFDGDKLLLIDRLIEFALGKGYSPTGFQSGEGDD